MNNSQKVQEIYFDESGFTGNNLLGETSPYFSYASVAISNEEAKEIIDKVKKDYRLQGNDIKGKNLVNPDSGRKAISEILEKLVNRSKFSFFEKKYVLATKLFEYIFEPTISEKNYVFYHLGFHKFISNFLYIEFLAKTESAEEIFAEFSDLMRELDSSQKQTNYLFNSSAFQEEEKQCWSMIDMIKAFSCFHRNVVKKELDLLKGTATGKWILDVTDTALHTLLCYWGQHFEQMNVFCDNSKPLKENQDLFNVMVAKKEKSFFTFNGVERPITYNLSNPINFVNSKKYPGIQLADVLAYVSIYIMQHDEPEINIWREPIISMASDFSVVPELNLIDPESFDSRRNFILFLEIMGRTVKQQNLLENIEEFILETSKNMILQSQFKVDYEKIASEDIPF